MRRAEPRQGAGTIRAPRSPILCFTGLLLLASWPAGAEERRCLLEQSLSRGASACFTRVDRTETVTTAPDDVVFTLPDGTTAQPALGDYRSTTLMLELTEGSATETVWELATRTAVAGFEPLARVLGLEEDAGLLFIFYTRLGYFYVDVLDREGDGDRRLVESLATGIAESFTSGNSIEEVAVARDGESYEIRCRFTRGRVQRWTYRPGEGLTALQSSDQPAPSPRTDLPPKLAESVAMVDVGVPTENSDRDVGSRRARRLRLRVDHRHRAQDHQHRADGDPPGARATGERNGQGT